MRGGLSGGTAASIMNIVKEVAGESRAAQGTRGPVFDLSRGVYSRASGSPVATFAAYDPDFNSWTAPFIMSAVNTRIVHRSNALSQQAYGAGFVYDEAMLTGRGLRGQLTAAGISAALGGFMVAGAIGPLRSALERFVLPSPGEGPSARGAAQGRLRPALPWPHQRRPGVAHESDGRPGSGLWLDGENPRRGRQRASPRTSVPRFAAVSGQRRRFLAIGSSNACARTPG